MKRSRHQFLHGGSTGATLSNEKRTFIRGHAHRAYWSIVASMALLFAPQAFAGSCKLKGRGDVNRKGPWETCLQASDARRLLPGARHGSALRQQGQVSGREIREFPMVPCPPWSQHPPGGLIVGHGNSIHYAQCRLIVASFTFSACAIRS